MRVMHLMWADQNHKTCNNCTFLWEQRSNSKAAQRRTKDIFCYKPDRHLLPPLNLPPIPSSSPLTLHSEAKEKSIYRLLYLPAQMLRLINAVALLEVAFFYYLFMAHLKTLHYLIMHYTKKSNHNLSSSKRYNYLMIYPSSVFFK